MPPSPPINRNGELQHNDVAEKGTERMKRKLKSDRDDTVDVHDWKKPLHGMKTAARDSGDEVGPSRIAMEDPEVDDKGEEEETYVDKASRRLPNSAYQPQAAEGSHATQNGEMTERDDENTGKSRKMLNLDAKETSSPVSMISSDGLSQPGMSYSFPFPLLDDSTYFYPF